MRIPRDLPRLQPSFGTPGLGAAGLLSFALLLFAAPLQAESWTFRACGQWTETSGDTFDASELDAGFGVSLGFEKRLDERWGVELGLGFSRLESDRSLETGFLGLNVRTEIESRLAWTPLTLAANYHLNPQGSVDVYLSPRLGWAFVDDLEIVTTSGFGGSIGLPGTPIVIDFPGFETTETRVNLASEDAFLYGLRVGVDWPIGESGWALSGAIDYLVMEVEFEPPPGTDAPAELAADIDPLSLGFGVSKSW